MARIRVSCILVEAQSDARILQDRINGGADFSSLAMTQSIHPSGVRGGDLGNLSRGQMEKAFDDVAFALSIGQITAVPIKGEAGWYIIYRAG